MNNAPRPDVRRLAQRLAALNTRWLRRTPLPDGRPLTYGQYRRLLQWVLAEHLEVPDGDR